VGKNNMGLTPPPFSAEQLMDILSDPAIEILTHPLGFLDIPLSSALLPSKRIGREAAVHAWHPRISYPQIPRQICHSHGWPLNSWVLAGGITTIAFSVDDVKGDSPGIGSVFKIEYVDDYSVSIRQSREVGVNERGRTRVSAGGHYFLEAEDFHWSQPDPRIVSVTLVARGNSSESTGTTIRPVDSEDEYRYRRTFLNRDDRDVVLRDTIEAIQSA
jgi:hypothetical protein